MTKQIEYSDLIRQTYLSYIRSVLIIDDEYPTLDGLLGRDLAKNSGKDDENDGENDVEDGYKYAANPEDVLRLINEFRTHTPPLLVDIHDGRNIQLEASETGSEKEVADRLHQSDLVILDYSLDPTNRDDPEKAIEILRTLSRNSHFNLVMMHSNTETNKVFESVVLGLLDNEFPLPDSGEKIELALEYLEDEHPGVYERLTNALTEDKTAYLAIRANPILAKKIGANKKFPFQRFTEICDEEDVDKRHRRYISQEILKAQHSDLEGQMSSEEVTQNVTYSDVTVAGCVKWLKSDTVFIGFTSKGKREEILSDMLSALSSWHPQPPRVLLRRMIAELDEKGALAEDAALGTKYASAKWYSDLLAAAPSARSSQISDLLSRHSETMLSHVEENLRSLTEDMIDLDNDRPAHEVLKEHFGVDLRKDDQKLEAVSEHNMIVSTVPISGRELTTGHILKIGSEYWICLSAACDLVPAQKNPGVKEVYGDDGIPVLAVRLTEVKKSTAGKSATGKKFIYLSEQGDLKCFCISPVPDDPGSYWDWHKFIAHDNAVFNESKKVFLSRIEHSNEDKDFKISRHEAEVVGQLRYPYAYALAEQLGDKMTRIGLGFVSTKN